MTNDDDRRREAIARDLDRRAAQWRKSNAEPLTMPVIDPNRPTPRPRSRRTSVRHRSIR